MRSSTAPRARRRQGRGQGEDRRRPGDDPRLLPRPHRRGQRGEPHERGDRRPDHRPEPRLLGLLRRRRHAVPLPARRRRPDGQPGVVRDGAGVRRGARREDGAPPRRPRDAQHLLDERRERRVPRLGLPAEGREAGPGRRRHRHPLGLAPRRADRGLQPRSHGHARGRALARALPPVRLRLQPQRRLRAGHARRGRAVVRVPGRQGHVQGPGQRPDPQLHGLLRRPLLLGVHRRSDEADGAALPPLPGDSGTDREGRATGPLVSILHPRRFASTLHAQRSTTRGERT